MSRSPLCPRSNSDRPSQNPRHHDRHSNKSNSDRPLKTSKITIASPPKKSNRDRPPNTSKSRSPLHQNQTAIAHSKPQKSRSLLPPKNQTAIAPSTPQNHDRFSQKIKLRSPLNTSTARSPLQKKSNNDRLINTQNHDRLKPKIKLRSPLNTSTARSPLPKNQTAIAPSTHQHHDSLLTKNQTVATLRYVNVRCFALNCLLNYLISRFRQ